jgi:pimeloyl-ACP methyl ester carboxylesterase
MLQENQAVNEPRLPYLEEPQRAFALYGGRTVFTEESVESSDGTPLTVLEAGDPQRPTVLLVNALGVSCLFLTEIAKRLADDYHVLTWESRGLPNELPMKGEGDLSVGRHCADGAHVLARKGRKADAMVAYCSGANVAVYAIAKQIIGAKRLCIISPSMEVGAVSEKTHYQRTMPPMWEKIVQSGPRYAALVRVLLRQHREFEAGSIDHELSYLNNLPFRTNQSTYRYAQLQAACLHLDWVRLLGQVKSPTLVLHAEHDDLIHVETSKAVAHAVAGAAFREIPGGGHFAIYTCGGLHDEVAAFLNGLEKPEPYPTKE